MKFKKFSLILICMLAYMPAAQCFQKLARLSGYKETGIRGYILGNRDGAIVSALVVLSAFVIKKLFFSSDPNVMRVLEQAKAPAALIAAKVAKSDVAGHMAGQPLSQSVQIATVQREVVPPQTDVSPALSIAMQPIQVNVHQACTTEIELLRAKLAERDATITQLKAVNIKHTKKIKQLEAIIQEQAVEIADQEGTIDRLSTELDERFEREDAQGLPRHRFA